jgi:hypothetical protein
MARVACLGTVNIQRSTSRLGVHWIEWLEFQARLNIQHPTSNIQHPTSNIQHPTSNIQGSECAFGGDARTQANCSMIPFRITAARRREELACTERCKGRHLSGLHVYHSVAGPSLACAPIEPPPKAHSEPWMLDVEPSPTMDHPPEMEPSA